MNSRLTSTFFLALGFLLAGTLAAQTFKAGSYYDRAYGDLQIETEQAGIQKFSLQTEGANAHTCTLEGTIKQGLSKDTADGCFIRFEQAADNSIRISVDGQKYPSGNSACHQNCGMRAWFTGEYKVRPDACDPSQVQKQRDIFLKQYHSKQYASALTTLNTVGSQCKDWFNWTTKIDLANDAAITLFHAGKKQQCLDTLKPYVDAADKPAGDPNNLLGEDEGLWELTHAPAFYDFSVKALKTIRTNLRLCGHKFPAIKKQ
jgi:hypothetical protein